MLNNLITSKTRLRLLIKFFISQANKAHLNGLASEFGESTNSIRKELNNLYDAGYLLKSKSNNKSKTKITFIENKTGGINIIDLANIYSCPFIATQDLGKKNPDNSFSLLGRFSEADVRGCNLLIQ